VLIQFNADETSITGVTIVPGYNITAVKVQDGNPSPAMIEKIESFFRKETVR